MARHFFLSQTEILSRSGRVILVVRDHCAVHGLFRCGSRAATFYSLDKKPSKTWRVTFPSLVKRRSYAASLFSKPNRNT
jgi:hypothetical protein